MLRRFLSGGQILFDADKGAGSGGGAGAQPGTDGASNGQQTDQTNASGQQAAAAGAQGAQTTVAFSEEQQSFINNLINTKYGEALAKGRDEGKSAAAQEMTTLQQQLDNLKQQLDQTSQQQRKESEKLVPVEQVNQQISSLQTEYSTKLTDLESKLQNMRALEKRTRIMGYLLGDLECVNPNQVADLVGNRFLLEDDGALKVLDENGRVAIDLNRGGQPMNGEAYLAQWLSKNPHFLKSRANGGAGSGTELSLANGQTLASSEIGKMDMETYMKNRSQIISAVDQGKIRS